mmetsp:Transcript_33350/g.103317  ORF Transcript_33350/g.103317 Transcript_33350/m.103317 type:complete len:275 (+) Transcript_33350:467-1291(+)
MTSPAAMATTQRAAATILSSGSRFVWPQSRIPTRPSSSSTTLPGCGSAWNSPSRNNCADQARWSAAYRPVQLPKSRRCASGRIAGAGGGGESRKTSRSFAPSSHSQTRTRSPQRFGRGAAVAIVSQSRASSRKSFAKRSSFSNSIRKSNSSAHMSRYARTTDGRSRPASSRSFFRSTAWRYMASTSARSSRLWPRLTFTATSVPLKRARWTCAMEAVATGVSSKVSKTSAMGLPRSRSTVRFMCRNDRGGAASIVSASASHQAGGIIWFSEPVI